MTTQRSARSWRSAFPPQNSEAIFGASTYAEHHQTWLQGFLAHPNGISTLRSLADYQYDVRTPGGELVRMRQAALQCHALAGWANSGYPVFNLTHSLEAALLLTDIDTEAPDLPFSAFVLHAPTTGNLLVHRYSRTLNDKGVEGQLYLGFEGLDHSQEYHQPWPNVTARVPAMNADGTPDVAAHDRAMRVLSMLCGFCSFVSSKSEHLEPDNEPREQAPRGAARPRVFTVGRTVKISPEIRSIATNHGGQPLWRLENRYIVRGHWRNQAVGPGRAERKKIWIAPHWKGPEGAEAWRHVYNVGASEAGI